MGFCKDEEDKNQDVRGGYKHFIWHEVGCIFIRK